MCRDIFTHTHTGWILYQLSHNETQEYWSGQSYLSPGDLPDPGIEPTSLAAPALQVDSLSLCHWGSPYMLVTTPLLVISFAYIFSHSVACLFILSVVSFALQKLLNFIRSHLFIFAFISFVLGDRFPQNIAPIYVKECCAYVFLQEFYGIRSYIQVFNSF